jgi:hypothetical protein
MSSAVTIRQLVDPDGGFTWDPDIRKYVDGQGNVVNDDSLRDAMDSYLEEQAQASDRLSNRLSGGGLSLPSWQSRFKSLLTLTLGASFLAGRGGRKQMDDAAKGKLGSIISGQFQWLDGFARDLSQGGLTPQALLARAKQYIAAGKQAFERGRTDTFDDLDLPAEPGFGCACGSRCRCYWDINEFPDRWDCYWICMNDPSTCDDCDQRSSDYSPWTQLKTAAQVQEDAA